MGASPRSSTHETQQTPAATTDDACYRLIAQIILKETVSGRDSKGHVFGLQVFEGSSFLSLKEKLWSFVFDYIQPLAHYTGVVNSNDTPSIADFDMYVSFKLNKQVIPTEDKLKKRLLKNKNETFTVLIYKWGLNIRSTSDLMEFRKACIDPVSVDRAGAADEQQQQEIVEQLRTYWGEHYEAFDATWRMCASHIHTKRAQHNVAREIQRQVVFMLVLLSSSKIPTWQWTLLSLVWKIIQDSFRIGKPLLNQWSCDLTQSRSRWLQREDVCSLLPEIYRAAMILLFCHCTQFQTYPNLIMLLKMTTMTMREPERCKKS
ncbi:hypothetical protein AC1031_000125 [Aphanomyces cochlioides]|nr:hypothetical protein AC1031_000125 [Aphanomyces cochlioides]